jgi:hypothetical protein
MIYSKFGTPLVLVSKTQSAGGKVGIQATAEGMPDIHEYALADLKADDGMAEIDAAVAALPVKVFDNSNARRRRPM